MPEYDWIPELVKMLYEIARDTEAPPNSRLTAIREIFDRTVGKGPLPAEGNGQAETPEIIFRIENGSSSP